MKIRYSLPAPKAIDELGTVVIHGKTFRKTYWILYTELVGWNRGSETKTIHRPNQIKTLYRKNFHSKWQIETEVTRLPISEERKEEMSLLTSEERNEYNRKLVNLEPLDEKEWEEFLKEVEKEQRKQRAIGVSYFVKEIRLHRKKKEE